MSPEKRKEPSTQVVENESFDDVESREIENSKPRSGKNMLSWLITLAIITLFGIVGISWIVSKQRAATRTENSESVKKDEGKETENGAEHGAEVKLSPETLERAGIKLEGVSSRPAVALYEVTGSIEANPQQTQTVTPLVSGRVEKVFVSIGDRVSANQTLATINSPEIAEKYGKWREAQTRFDNAKRSFERVQRSENRVGVLSAQARLNEAETNLDRTKRAVEANILSARAKLSEADATLKRTKRLIELGAGAGKDLIAAESNYKVEAANLQSALSSRDFATAQAGYKIAKADFDFQSNIGLNKEIQEAEAELKTAQIEATHEKQSLEALGVNINSINSTVTSIAAVPVRSSLSGIVTERMTATGSGVQAGQTLFTLSNVSTVWVTANVPEQQMSRINIGSIATIKTPILRGNAITARVSYIDPNINEDTRTAKVRLEIANPNGRLRAGMFATIAFQTGTSAENGEELVVPSESVQRIDEKEVVFVPVIGENGTFTTREIETDGETNGYTRIKEGLELNETVVTKGSFALKTQLQKGELGEE